MQFNSLDVHQSAGQGQRSSFYQQTQRRNLYLICIPLLRSLLAIGLSAYRLSVLYGGLFVLLFVFKSQEVTYAGTANRLAKDSIRQEITKWQSRR